MPPLPVDIESQKINLVNRDHANLNAIHMEGKSIHQLKTEVSIPAEYRTLSIHVDDSAQLEKGKTADKRKLLAKDLSALDWHKISVEEALSRLSVSPNIGLESAQVSRNHKLHGMNIISPPKRRLGRKLLEWVLGGFGSLLLTASIICFIAWKPLGEPNPQVSNLALGVVLLLVLIIQAVLNAWQDYSTSRVMASIKGMLPTDVLVLRNSSFSKVEAKNLVPGDIITLTLGEKVPADLKLLEVSADLQFDRSILTGESDPVSGRVEETDKNFLETKNIALQGTHCISGSGKGLVIQTGDNTVFGAIAKLSSTEVARLTTLQRELLRFVAIIAGMALTVAIIIVILWATWLRVEHPGYIDVPELLADIVSVMVACLPDGLPIAVTLSMAQVAHILSTKKVLCKSLSIVETLGSVNVLCSDKTGTLTQNIMHVENLAVYDTVFDSNALQSAGTNEESIIVELNICQVAAIGAICNAATFENSISDENNNARNIAGNATDVAILRFSDSIVSADATRRRWVDVYRKNFNSKTKYMLQLSKLSSGTPIDSKSLIPPLAPSDNFTSDSFLLTAKGAPDVLLPHCTHTVDPNGGPPIKLNGWEMDRISSIQEKWSRQGHRVILLAKRVIRDIYLSKASDTNSEEYAEAVDEFMHGLTIVGIVGLIDPLKPDIKHTVQVCRGAGIRFMMVTGDHPSTALSIAGQAGIISDTSAVHSIVNLNVKEDEPIVYDYDIPDYPMKSIMVTGAELMTLSSPQFYQLCQYEEIVFARTTPEQKLRIVNAFKGYGNCVAVTGDGVNDAPSLKAADCGVAMGNGSDVAKEAADLVLLGDFSSIITAIEYGRLVFDNLKKTVLYLLPAGSFSELTPIILNVLFGIPQILSNIQMIIICVATDVLPALSLCLEPPESGLLLRRPRDVRKDKLVNIRLFFHAYAFLGVLESLCAMSMSFWFLQRNGVPFSSLALSFATPANLTDELLFKAQSVYFFTLVIMQWGNLLATRCRKLSIFQHTPDLNWYAILAALCALGIAILFSAIPWFQKIFQTRLVPIEYFFIPLAFGIGLLFLDEMRKYFVRKYPKSLIAWLAW